MKSREEVEEVEWETATRGGREGGEFCQGKDIFPVFLSYSRILQTLKIFPSKHLQKDSERLKWLNFKTP